MTVRQVIPPDLAAIAPGPELGVLLALLRILGVEPLAANGILPSNA